jgi:hypothetical protein
MATRDAKSRAERLDELMEEFRAKHVQSAENARNAVERARRSVTLSRMAKIKSRDLRTAAQNERKKRS